MTKLTRRSFLPAALLAPLAGRAAAPPRPTARPGCPPADRARLRAAAAAFEAAADALFDVTAGCDRARADFRAGAVGRDDLDAVLWSRWLPAADRLAAADAALTAVMRACGVAALVVGGELYLDSGQDDSGDLDCGKNVFTVAASFVLDLDAAGPD